MNLLTRARARVLVYLSRCPIRLRAALTLRSMLAAIAALVVASCLAVIGVGGSYAFLNSRAQIAAGTLQSGTAALSVATLALPTAGMYPGQTVYGAATVSNAGNVPLAIQISSLTAPTNAATTTALTPYLTVGLSVVATAAVCTGATPPTPTWTGTFASAPAANLGATIAVGGATIVCVSVSLAPTVPSAGQGLTATGFAVVLSGTQA